MINHHNAWLTPDSPLAPGDVYRALIIPLPFEQYVRGALGLLCDKYNWELDGDMTPQECADAMLAMSIAWGKTMLGTIHEYCTTTLPDGVLLCDGTVYDRADYPDLYAVLDAAYIDDADHFHTPNMVNRSPMGTDTEQGQIGGAFTHTLVADEMPGHTHVDAGHTHTEAIAAPNLTTVGLELPEPTAIPAASVTGVGVANIQSAGGGQAHNNLHPVHYTRYGMVAR